MNQNQMNMMGNNGYPMPNQSRGFKLEITEKDKKIFFAFLACLVILAVGCFLPFLVQKASNLKVNYVSSGKDIKNGVFVIVIGIAAIFSAVKKKYIVSLILQCISAGVFIIDAVDALDRMKKANDIVSILGGDYKVKFGIGFYLVLVGIIGSLVTAFLLWKANKNTTPTVAPVPNTMPNMQQPMYQEQPVQPQPVVQNNCPYCGTPRNQGSAFCGNCGAKF